MTTLAQPVTNESVIPEVRSSLFIGNEDKRFAVGILAVCDMANDGLENEYTAYYDLRKNVYVDQKQFLSPAELGLDGTDRDEDDHRSVAFGVVENLGDKQRLVAVARLIVKGMTGNLFEEDAGPLPVEKEWPELFTDQPANQWSVEVSRLISRHEKPALQSVNKTKLYAAALAHVQTHELGPAYAIVEETLERDLSTLVPIVRIGEPKYVEHYSTTNVPIEIDVPGLAHRMEEQYPGTLDAMLAQQGAFAYYGKALTQRSVA